MLQKKINAQNKVKDLFIKIIPRKIVVVSIYLDKRAR
jgi:hypothetical protein